MISNDIPYKLIAMNIHGRRKTCRNEGLDEMNANSIRR